MDSFSQPPRWARWLFACILLAYAVYLGASFAPVAAGADASGYMHSARLFAEGKLTTPMRPTPEITARHPLHTTPVGFEVHQVPGRLDPTYPCGFPLQLAAAYRIFGERLGTALVVISAALATMMLCYLFAREVGVHWPLAGAGAMALTLSPAFIFTSVIPMSDTVATAWCLAAYYFALRSRRGLSWALACGVACGMAVLVRPSCVVALAAVPLLLRGWRAWALVAVAGIPAAAWQLFYQHILYGSASQSGYGPIFEAFRLECFMPTQGNYGVWFPRLFPAALLALLLIIWLPWRQRFREVLALLLWFFFLYLFYSFYDISQQAWWYLRFIMPGVPALVILAMMAVQGTAERFSGSYARQITLASALVIAVSPLIVFNYWERRHTHITLLKSYQQPYLDTSAWLNAHCEPNAIVASLTLSGTIYYYTGFPVLRYDLLEKEDAATYLDGFKKSGRPLYAAVISDETRPSLQERLPGRWEKMVQFDLCTIYRYAPP